MAYNTGLFRNDSGNSSVYVDQKVRELPPELAAGIIEDAQATSSALKLGEVTKMNSRTKVFTIKESPAEAYWIKGTTDALGGAGDGSRASKDVALKQTTSMSWSEKKMEAEEIAVVVPLPDTWESDSDVDFGVIRPDLVAAVAVAIDNAILWGTEIPSSWVANGFNGVLPDTLASGNTVSASDIHATYPTLGLYRDLADAIAAMAELMAEDGYDPTGFVTYPGFKWKLVRLRSDDGTPIYATVPGSPAQTVYGQPLEEVRNGTWNTHKDDALMIAGDWSKLKIGIRQDLQWAISDSAPIFNTAGELVLNTFQQDAKVIRLTFRIAANIVNPHMRLGGEFPFSALVPTGDLSS